MMREGQTMGSGTPDAAVKFTYEDYLLFPEDGLRHEIIDGEHEVTPSPLTRHQRIVANLFRILDPFIRERKLGEVFLSPFDVILSNLDIVVPDLLFVSGERSAIVTEKNLQGAPELIVDAPELIVEVLSEGTRKGDEVTKRKLYERFGVQEYWIADPVLESIKVYRQSGKGFERVAELSVEAGETLTSPLFPGLTIPLDAVFGIPVP
jgi:Uma2 family endonuclease